MKNDETCENFRTLDRPSHLGKKRDDFVRSMNEKYGEGNWRLAWKIGNRFVPFEQAIILYEGAYFLEVYNNIDFWKGTFLEYSECYDNAISNVKSGLDYSIQRENSNHYQDISVRRVMLALGLRFGSPDKPLMWIRHNSKDDGSYLSPGRVKFHLPKLIVQPELSGWWETGSTESFWQSNKFLQAKILPGDVDEL
jgi:hypothetical protein